MDWMALGPNDLDISQGGGLAYIIVSLVLIWWMWQGIRDR